MPENDSFTILRMAELMRLIETMHEAFVLGRFAAFGGYDPDAEGKPVPSLVYDPDAAVDVFDGLTTYKIVQYIKDEDGSPVYYGETGHFPVLFAIAEDEDKNAAHGPSAIILLDGDADNWIEIDADGWSLENDIDRPTWFNAIPIRIGKDGNTIRYAGIPEEGDPGYVPGGAKEG